MKNILVCCLMLNLALFTSCQQAQEEAVVEEEEAFEAPIELYGQLMIDVQMAAVFPDGKTFVDCVPKYAPAEIVKKYEAAKNQQEFHIKAFVLENFDLPKQYASGFEADTSRSLAEHIRVLWPILTREADTKPIGTLIPLPNDYIVPGGRFGEIYYWDSYFTMLGLRASKELPMIKNMVNNFAYLIDTIGFIPNGNRTYFLTRSQPPFFAAMVQLIANEEGEQVYEQYLSQLTKEYNFWMDGIDKVSADQQAVRHVVRMDDGSILNRYWDAGKSPRGEMYKDDVETMEKSGRPAEEIYRDIRSACESGWDFSSRWFKETGKMESIHTTDIIPVDLNALLYNLENVLEKANRVAGNSDVANRFQQLATQRKDALLKYCWDESTGYFRDYDFEANNITPVPSLAGIYPLFFKMATPEQGDAVAEVIKSNFLKPGGLVSTLNNNGQQWDAPNGWAPLQWIAIKGLRNYEAVELADEVKNRWISLNTKVYKNTGKMVEKYNVEDLSLEAGGGEYPVQDGFGWSNGVLLQLLAEN